MKRFIKILTFISLSAVLLVSVCLFAGCSEDGENGKGSPVVEDYFTISKNNYLLELLETAKLSVSTNISGKLVWNSDNESVVTVDEDGYIKGVGEGNATVSVTLGDKTLTCRVTVSASEYVPAIVLEEADELDFYIGDKYDLKPFISYKGESFGDGEFSYEIYDEGVISIDKNGRISALKSGETTVLIKGDWRIFKGSEYITKTVPVRVNYNIRAEIDQKELKLYNYALSAGGQEFKTEDNLTCTVIYNGSFADGDMITWHSSDENVVSVDDNGKVCAVSTGVAEITIEFRDGDVVARSLPLPVSVTKPIIDRRAKTPILIDAFIDNDKISIGKTEISYDLESVFPTAESVSSVENAVSGEAITYNGGKFDKNALSLGESEWLISNGNYDVLTKVVVATKVIRTAKELADMMKYADYEEVDYHYVVKENGEDVDKTRKQYNYGGYFVLGNDITFTDNDYAGEGYLKNPCLNMGSTAFENEGFCGTFDGLGRKIYNFKAGIGGIVGQLAKSGVVKNVTFENAQLGADGVSPWNASVVANNISGTVENVKITVNLNKAYESAALAYRIYNGTLKNVEITASNPRTDYVSGGNKIEYGTVINWSSGTNCVVENVSVNRLNGVKVIKADQGNIAALIVYKD